MKASIRFYWPLKLICFSSLGLLAQLPYTNATFAYDSIANIPYGLAVNYNQQQVPLFMDIYKPKGDANCRRPAVVLVHGGAWIAGSKNDPGVRYMAREFARRGWVAATVNYRLGMHNTNNFVMYALCNSQISAPCAYVADTAEVYRALFRAMQDTKGAVRFLKSRFATDSIDVGNVFVVGESAGGFTALATAFMTEEDEKPIECSVLANVPTPSANLQPYGCTPSNLNLTRPDLGSVNGNLHLGTFDATVQGVGSIFGGVLNPDILNKPGPKPSVYLFHQGSDVIVNWKQGRLLGRLSYECFAPINLCQPYFNMPIAYGSESIREFFDQSANAPHRTVDIINNYNYMNDCLANGHSVDNWPLRINNMVQLFAQKIASGGNTPISDCTTTLNAPGSTYFNISPNPVDDNLYIQLSNSPIEPLQIEIRSVDGRLAKQAILHESGGQISLAELRPGIYWAFAPQLNLYHRFVKIR